MVINNNDDLTLIIKSLTKHEKIFFKRFCAGYKDRNSKNYLKLFNLMDEVTDGNIETIKNKYKLEKFNKYFSANKSYLKKLVFRSLILYHSGESGERFIDDSIRISEILYKKALYNICKSFVDKIKRIAYKHESYVKILSLIKLQRNLIHEGVYKGNGFKHLEKTYIEENEVLSKIKNISDFRILSYKTRELIIRNGNKNNKTQKILQAEICNSPLLQSETMAKSITALMSYYHIKSFVAQFLTEYNNAYIYRLKLLDLLKNNSIFIRKNPANYVVTLNNIINDCININNLDKAELYINEMNSIVNRNDIRLSENSMILIFVGGLMNDFWFYIIKGKFDDAYRNINKMELGIMNFIDKINKFDSLNSILMVASVYFAVGKYEKSLQWVNKALNEYDISVDEMKYIFAKILHLLIHYELKNFSFIENSVKYVKRYLKDNKVKSQLCKITIELLTDIINCNTEKQRKEVYHLAVKKLSHMDDLEKGFILYWYVEAFVMSKMLNQSFDKVYKITK